MEKQKNSDEIDGKIATPLNNGEYFVFLTHYGETEQGEEYFDKGWHNIDSEIKRIKKETAQEIKQNMLSLRDSSVGTLSTDPVADDAWDSGYEAGINECIRTIEKWCRQ